MNNHTKNKRLIIRVTSQIHQLIELQCNKENRTKSDVINAAIAQYLQSDFNEESLILAKLSTLKKDSEVVKTKIDIHISLFEFWLTTFFASIPSPPDDPEMRSRNNILASSRKHAMIADFEQYFKQNPSFFEKLKINLQDYGA